MGIRWRVTLGLRGRWGGEGKPDFWPSFNADGPHKADVAVLEMKGKKSGAVFTIFYFKSAINEIFPNTLMFVHRKLEE